MYLFPRTVQLLPIFLLSFWSSFPSFLRALNTSGVLTVLCEVGCSRFLTPRVVPRKISVVLVPVPGTELLKPLGFPEP